VRNVILKLSENGNELQNASSDNLGKGQFVIAAAWNSLSKYEIYTNDTRFILPPTVITVNQAHYYTQFKLTPFATVMVNYIANISGSIVGAVGLNVMIYDG